MTETTVLQWCYVIFYRGIFSYFLCHVISLWEGDDLCLQDWQTLRDIKETMTIRKDWRNQTTEKNHHEQQKNTHSTNEANTKTGKTFHFDFFFFQWWQIFHCHACYSLPSPGKKRKNNQLTHRWKTVSSMLSTSRVWNISGQFRFKSLNLEMNTLYVILVSVPLGDWIFQ